MSVIGISFGGAYSCISIIGKEGTTPEPIANEDGDRLISTCVAFTGYETLCGTQAKIQALANPTGTIIEFRDMLAKSMDDPHVQALQKKYKMNIVAGPKGKPVFETLKYVDGEEEPKTEQHTAEQVTTLYLAKLKETAESNLSAKVDGCVISVPAHYEEAQKQALLACAKAAGFTNAAAIPEPVAACLAFENKSKRAGYDHEILVLDMGEHQLNVTHLTQRDGLIDIKESLEFNDLGGSQLDHILVEYSKQEFFRKTKMDISDNRRSIQKLKSACERTKRSLTRQDTAPLAVESLYDGMDFSISVIRGRFEMLCDPTYEKCKDAVKSLLKSINLPIERVDQVLLVGGCARIPRFQAQMKGMFSESTDFRSDIEPDEAISIGCAIQAQLMREHDVSFSQLEKNPQAKLTSQSIGIYNGSKFVPLIPAGTPIPLIRTFSLGISDSQTEAYLALYSLENKTGNKTLLVELVLSDLEVGVTGRKVDVKLIIESDCHLQLSMSEKSSGQKVEAKVD